MQKIKFSGEDHIYVQVAEGIEKMIADDVLQIGDKLPSVRLLSNEHGISMGTAFKAYYHLEGKGLIESRPKSGYYVRFNQRRFPGIPKTNKAEPVESEVSIKDMIATVYKDISASDVINFALAIPALELLPASKLNKSIGYALRNSKSHCLLYEHVQGNVNGETSNESLIRHPKVIEMYTDLVESFNKYFNPVEQIKKFELLPSEWSVETGEMTPKLSLKRKVVMEKFRDTVERIYG